MKNVSIGRVLLPTMGLAMLVAANWVAAPVDEADAYTTLWTR